MFYSGSLILNLENQICLKKMGYEYGYTMFKQLYVIYVDSTPFPPVNISNVEATVVKEERGEDKDIQLSLSKGKGLMHRTMTLSVLLY